MSVMTKRPLHVSTWLIVSLGFLLGAPVVSCTATPGVPLLNFSAAIVQGWEAEDGNFGTPIWDVGLQGKDQIVAVADNGIDDNSCFFRDAAQGTPLYTPGSGTPVSTHRKLVSVIPIALDNPAFMCYTRADIPSSDSSDSLNSHGTAIAAAVAGSAQCAPGVDCFGPYGWGIAPQAKLVIQDVLPRGKTAAVVPCDIAAFLSLARDHGAKIHATGWGVFDPAAAPMAYGTTSRGYDDFMVKNADFLAIVGVGNFGASGSGSVYTPGDAKNVLTVGAGLVDQEKAASFSSQGPTPDGRTKPDVIAPGSDIWSGKNGGTASGSSPPTCETAKRTGTGVASGLVAGAAAVLREYLVGGYYVKGKNATTAEDTTKYGIPNPNAMLLKALLIISTDIFEEVDPLTRSASKVVHSGTVGFGRVNLAQLMFPDVGITRQRIWFNSHKPVPNPAPAADAPLIHMKSITNGDKMHTFCVRIRRSGTPFRAVLAWADPVAPAGATVQLQNDLDLWVYSDLLTLKGNHGERPDSVNTVEATYIESTAPGDYKIIVHLRQPALIGTSALEYTLALSGDFADPTVEAPTCPGGCPRQAGFECSGAGTCGANGVCSCNTQTNEFLDCSGTKVQWDTTNASSPCATVCNKHGCPIAPGSTTCMCYQDAINGYYKASSACEACDVYNGVQYYYNNKDKTLGKCVDEKTCSGRGFSPTDNICVCNKLGEMLPGETTLRNIGSWGGPSCGRCASGWFGVTCKCESADCNGHGRCTADGCQCDSGGSLGWWAGKQVALDTVMVNTTCDVCAPGYSSPESGCICLNTTKGECDGHGRCTKKGCMCHKGNDTGYWEPNDQLPSTCSSCSVGWGPSGGCKAHLATCEIHGSPVAEGCLCHRTPANGFWQSDNPVERPCDANGITCGSNCITCATGYVGPGLSRVEFCKCPFQGQLLCSGHGVCSDTGCQCTATDADGFWKVGSDPLFPSCDTCADAYIGPNGDTSRGCRCNRSPVDSTKAQCEQENNGACREAGCSCFNNFTHGYWASSDNAHLRECSRCVDGAGGPGCICQSQTCDGHGTCGDSGCVCAASYDEGFWTSTANLALFTTANGRPNPIPALNHGCSTCQYNFSSISTGCLCNDTYCKDLVIDDQWSCSDETASSSRCNVFFPVDSTAFLLRYPQKLFKYGPSGQKKVLRFRYVPKVSKSHPLKSQPPGFRYFEGTSFELEIHDEAVVGVRKSKVKVQQTTEAVTFDAYLDIRMRYLEDPQFKDGDTVLTVNYEVDPPILMYLDVDAWKAADETCPEDLRIAVADRTDRVTTLALGRVCSISGPTQFALFVKVKEPDQSILVLVAFICACVVVLLVIALLITALKRRVARARREREAKEHVIAFVTQQRAAGGKSLRSRLGLARGEKFTPKMAAERYLEKTKKTRRLMHKYYDGSFAGGKDQAGAIVSAVDGSKAVAMLTTKKINKAWEFKDSEMEYLQSCKNIRGMFEQDPYSREWRLRQGALPDMLQSLVDLQMDNERLKHVLLATKQRAADEAKVVRANDTAAHG